MDKIPKSGPIESDLKEKLRSDSGKVSKLHVITELVVPNKEMSVKPSQKGGGGDADQLQQKSDSLADQVIKTQVKKETVSSDLKLNSSSSHHPHPCNVCKTPGILQCAGCESVWYCSLPHLQKDWRDHRTNCYPLTRVVADPETKLPYLGACKDLRKGSIIVFESTYFTFADAGSGYGEDIFEDVDKYNFIQSFPKQLICVGCFCKVEKINVSYCPDCQSPVCKAKCAELCRHSDEVCEILRNMNQAKNTSGNFLPTILEEIPSGLQLFYDFIAVLRILLLKKDNTVAWRQFESALFPIGDDQIRDGKNSHMAQQQQLVLAFEKLFSKLTKVVGPGENVVELGFRILNVLKRRSMAYPPNVADTYQRSLSPKVAFIEHSCLPNVDISVTITGIVHVKALREIKKGEKILAGFVNLLRPSYERQLLLQIQRYADCSCERCLDPSELGTYFGSLKCYNLQGCNGKGLFILENPEDMGHFDKILVWKCQLCKFQTTHFYIVNKIKEALKLLMTGLYTENRRIDLVYLEENLLWLMSEANHFHSKHFLVYKFQQKFANLFGCNSQGRWCNDDFYRKVYLCEQVSRVMEELSLELSTMNAETTYNLINTFSCMDSIYSILGGPGLSSTYPKVINALTSKLWNSVNHYDDETTFGEYAKSAENIARNFHSSPGVYLSIENENKID